MHKHLADWTKWLSDLKGEEAKGRPNTTGLLCFHTNTTHGALAIPVAFVTCVAEYLAAYNCQPAVGNSEADKDRFKTSEQLADMFGDPTPWLSHAFPEPEWVNNVSTSATTLYHVLRSFNTVETHVFDNCYDAQITTLKFSIFTFIDNKVLGKDLYSQSQNTFGRRMPEQLGTAADTAWKQFFNKCLSSNELCSSNETNDNYHMVASKILQHYLSCPDGVRAYQCSLPSHFEKRRTRGTRCPRNCVLLSM